MDKNPNFIYKKSFDIIEQDIFEINNAFDIYNLLEDKNITYLCGSHDLKREILLIFEFDFQKEDFKKVLSLEKHKEFITGCKYFLNKKNKAEYLVSNDNGKNSSTLIIWQILSKNNYQPIFNIDNEDFIRYPFTLIFNSDNTYLIRSNKENQSELISFDKEISNIINFSEEKILQYLIYEKSENDLVIQSNRDEILIYDVFNNKLYKKIEDDFTIGNNNSISVIYKKDEDNLCVVNQNGNVLFYNLENYTLIFVVKIKDNNLMNLCQFNENYIFILSKNGKLFLLDYYNKKIISKTNKDSLNKNKTIKMIQNDIYGKYLIIGGFMKGISLYKNSD